MCDLHKHSVFHSPCSFFCRLHVFHPVASIQPAARMRKMRLVRRDLFQTLFAPPRTFYDRRYESHGYASHIYLDIHIHALFHTHLHPEFTISFCLRTNAASLSLECNIMLCRTSKYHVTQKKARTNAARITYFACRSPHAPLRRRMRFRLPDGCASRNELSVCKHANYCFCEIGTYSEIVKNLQPRHTCAKEVA